MTGRDLALLEHEQRRNALNAELSGEPRFGIDVDLDEPGLRLEFLRGLLEYRSHHSAGSAPSRPEVRDNGQFGPVDMSCEPLTGEFDRFALEQLCTACATLGRLERACLRDPVHLVAFRADDMERVGHLQAP